MLEARSLTSDATHWAQAQVAQGRPLQTIYPTSFLAEGNVHVNIGGQHYMLGGDGVSYGVPAPKGETWRERFLSEVSSQIDPDRVAFPGRTDYLTYLALLRRSDAHVYLTYPFVASWSLREAMACGCAIVASDTAPVREFISDGETGVLTPFQRLNGRILIALDGTEHHCSRKLHCARCSTRSFRCRFRVE